jgi:hypothetical protein
MHHPSAIVRPSASQESAPRPLRAPRAVKAQGATLRLAVVLRCYHNGWAVRVLVGDSNTRPSYPVFSTYSVNAFEAAAAAWRFIHARYPRSIEPRFWWFA